MSFREYVVAAVAFVIASSATHHDIYAASSSGVSEDTAQLTAAVAAENTKSMVVLKGGEPVFSYGPVDAPEPTYTASVRKSILTMLMGQWVDKGVIDVDKTLADLGIDDIQGLTEQERTARVKDLLAARSGIYHPASNFSGVTDAGPKRGDHAPDTYYWYNNWDFNAVGTIFEELTGASIFDEFSRQFVGPMGLQKFDAEKHKTAKAEHSRENSQHPPYYFLLSSTDLAKLGQLMLQKGVWEGERLLSEDWVEESVALITPSKEMNPESFEGGELGYGYMWWVFDPATSDPKFEDAYVARGHFGQYILVMPKLDMVIAHKTEPIPYKTQEEYAAINVSWDEFRKIVDVAIETFADES